MSIKLSQKDLKIMSSLESDSRQSISSIARQVGVSKEVANYRIKRFSDLGLIKGFVVNVDYTCLGFSLYKFDIDLVNVHSDTRSKFIFDLKRERNARVNSFVQSSRDIEIFFWARNSHEVDDFLHHVLDKYSQYINKKEVLLVTKCVFTKSAYLHSKREITFRFDSKCEKVDEVDMKIIDRLSENPRMQIIELAKKLKIPQSTAVTKIKTLYRRGVIKNVVPVIDSSMIGYTRFGVDISFNNLKKRKAIFDYLCVSKHIVSVFEYVGSYDLGFECYFRNAIELEKFIETIRNETDGISNFDVKPILLNY